ncbi:hypothetical protein GRI97_09850 [Altererythrobacter xixiisoli]|uniref:Uncharacterized protein n=1 Tax=Croceibacterium xixiisoli TaxID=1476466 RepID=A0A6I4TTV7_9SPHN|nr:hypothetical protein [Croceibacterium xixiisoli]MXO99292.1 hypothetical protein [Croceibacterium xixiisoli]
MQTHTRALIAAAAFAFVTGRKVAGMFDHTAGQDLRIAAEARGDRLQGHDGDRDAAFGGTLPEIQEAGASSSITIKRHEGRATGYDRASETHFEAVVEDGMVKLYDHGEAAWFAYEIQDADAAQSYYRGG